MKLYQRYIEVTKSIGKVEVAWFTTFNCDPELVEKFLFPPLVGKDPKDLMTAEDFEALNLDMEQINIKILYDYRVMNYGSMKRTTADFIPVEPAMLYNGLPTKAVFHPKVIFVKGTQGAYLFAGSANLSLAAWGSNKESVIIKKIESRRNAEQVMNFFDQLGCDTDFLRSWSQKLRGNSNWDFHFSINNKFNLLNKLTGNELTIWSPYFAKKTYEFIKDIAGHGFKQINVVPGRNANGRVMITPEELRLIRSQLGNCLYQSCVFDGNQLLHHAKVWLTDKQLAVGSWNCTHRATGLIREWREANIEAGIIVDIDPATRKKLLGTIREVNIGPEDGTSQQNLDEDWEELLADYSISVQIMANWQTHRYELRTNSLYDNLLVALPHDPDNLKPLNSINGLSFSSKFRRVLNNKLFIVYNTNKKIVYQGYLIEIEAHNRPVRAFLTISDALDSLVADADHIQASAKCIYSASDQLEGEDDLPPAVYVGKQSFYKTFVAFQRLSGKIEKEKMSQEKLMDIGFRSPGALVHINHLLEEEIKNAEKENNQDNDLYFFFMAQELNGCIRKFKQYWKGELSLPEITIKSVEARLGFGKNDWKFLRKLSRDFDYEFS